MVEREKDDLGFCVSGFWLDRGSHELQEKESLFSHRGLREHRDKFCLFMFSVVSFSIASSLIRAICEIRGSQSSFSSLSDLRGKGCFFFPLSHKKAVAVCLKRWVEKAHEFPNERCFRPSSSCIIEEESEFFPICPPRKEKPAKTGE